MTGKAHWKKKILCQGGKDRIIPFLASQSSSLNLVLSSPRTDSSIAFIQTPTDIRIAFIQKADIGPPVTYVEKISRKKISAVIRSQVVEGGKIRMYWLELGGASEKRKLAYILPRLDCLLGLGL